MQSSGLESSWIFSPRVLKNSHVCTATICFPRRERDKKQREQERRQRLELGNFRRECGALQRCSYTNSQSQHEYGMCVFWLTVFKRDLPLSQFMARNYGSNAGSPNLDSKSNGEVQDHSRSLLTSTICLSFWFMVSVQQLLIYGSPVVVAIAFLVLQYPDWVSFASLESLDQLGSFLANLLSDTNIFVLSAAYARWALPWPWASRESTQLKTVAAVSVGLVAKWNVEAARKASDGATSDIGPCRYLLFHYWPLFVAHMNSYLFAAILTDFFAVAMLAGWQALILTLYFTVWWHPLADMLFRALDIFLPVSEVASAFHILREVVGKEDFDCCAAELFIVVSYVQISLGYVNIWYMRQDKARSNALLDVASGKLAAQQFLTQRVMVYVSSVALPYMFQRSIMETANSASFRHFFNKVEESLRVDAFLHAGENPHNRLEVVRDSNYTVDGYTESFNHLIHTCYNMIEGKLWELPNLVLLSGMLFGQPLLTLTLLPVSIGLDFARVRAVSFVTVLVEETSKRRRGLADKRKKIEQHDSRHAEIISRTGAASIVANRWDGLASEILDVTIWQTFLVASRTYMNWIYYNNLLGVGIECALARIMEIDQITKADIGVYAMVINDAIGFLLTRYQKAAFEQCIIHPWTGSAFCLTTALCKMCAVSLSCYRGPFTGSDPCRDADSPATPYWTAEGISGSWHEVRPHGEFL